MAAGMMVGEGGLDSNEDGGIVFMTGEYAPVFSGRNGADGSGQATTGEATGENTRGALE